MSDVLMVDTQAEIARVEALTAVERRWMSDARVRLFDTDAEIMEAARSGSIVRVESMIGFVLRPMLQLWQGDRSDKRHKYHYSPPFALAPTRDAIYEMGEAWRQEVGDEFVLCVSSLVRSRTYQEGLVARGTVVAVGGEGLRSSHEGGLSFDVPRDFYWRDQEGQLHAYNRRNTTDHTELDALDAQLTNVLGVLAGANIVEENIASSNACVHICIPPD